MIPKLVQARYIAGYRLWLSFEDGSQGELDLESELWGEVFEPLKDIERFKAFRLDTELNTVVWTTGADLAPEYLYEAISA